MQGDSLEYILAIDIGNSRTKMGLWSNGQWLETGAFPNEEMVAVARDWILSHEVKQHLWIGWSSVSSTIDPCRWTCWKELRLSPSGVPISHKTNFPIGNLYESPETLGIDRILAVIGAWSLFPEQALLIIDAGTAITYDLIDREANYQGGAIAAGIAMRFKALHDYTARLPHVSQEGDSPWIGKTTEECIRSGVLNGIIAEAQGFAEAYAHEMKEELMVILTGGNLSHFENRLKNIIFADHYLVLKGIAKTISHLHE